MLRVVLLLATNGAIILVLAVSAQILGLDRALYNSSGLALVPLLVFSAVFGFGGSFLSLVLSKTLAKVTMRVRIIATPTTAAESWLINTVRQLSEQAGIGMPQVGIFPMQQANAFATGWNKNAALVAVSEGMVGRFSQEELAAVLGHEIAHVANGDMVTLTLIQGILNTFVLFFARIVGTIVDRVIFKNERGLGLGYYAVTIAAQIVFGFLAAIVVSWFSRYREFRADAGGGQLTSNKAMIAALQRLQQEQGQPASMPESLAAFGIHSAGGMMEALFSSHPPLEKRIETLSQRSALGKGISG